MIWRPMGEADLDAVAAVALEAFPDHFEGRDCFANRLALNPRGCFVLEAEGALAGYLVAYPWTRDAVPALNTLLDALPERPEVLYLHDLALAGSARGRGATREIVERLAAQGAADGWPALTLAAVNDAAGFWRRHGFERRETPALRAKLTASYGPDAVYMVRPLQPGRQPLSAMQARKSDEC